jgi:cbb3-type cytochrome oxidase maturation protein
MAGKPRHEPVFAARRGQCATPAAGSRPKGNPVAGFCNRLTMDIVFLLVPLGLLVVFVIGAIFWWAVASGQFDDLDDQGEHVIVDGDSEKGPPNGG